MAAQMARNRGMDRKDRVWWKMCGHRLKAAEVQEAIKRRERKERLRIGGKASRRYSLCYGVTIPRGCENADGTKHGVKGKWAKALIAQSF